MIDTIKQIWTTKDLRNKILFTLGLLVIYRFTTQISVPGVNLDTIRGIYNQNSILGIFSAMTGGSAENFSIVMMGLSPYINASIIMQLLTVIVPQLESLSKEGEQGRKKINKYTRWLTAPLAFLQSYGMIVLINSQSPTGVPIIENIYNPAVIIPIMITLTAGTVFIMWLGELMTEKGIGNGISLIIFAGIISQVPIILGQQLGLAQEDTTRLIPFTVMLIITLLLTVLVILMTEGQRQLKVTYAGKGQGKAQNAVLPIRVNQAGMIPIIFAISMVTFPSVLAQLLTNATSPWLRNISDFLNTYFQINSIAYGIAYFIFIMGFTFFYVSITFNPEEVAENIQKRGGYIPGIRPGKETAEYLGKVSGRLNLFGGLFLAFIGISPIILEVVFQDLFATTSIPLIISGAGLIIVVGVVLELIRQVNAQLIMQDYNKLLR